ncbi:SDR family NAD(P)-dependent oxidoreductase [Roseomonas sp. BN140053]|uniref:SDR family NAD(P)-dependent oxidoreductase n=1 Tax=Roseomonas sp. BN140053 TaxID=3391898 RepID=UPI0039E92590
MSEAGARRFAGKVIAVSGAAGGIGEALTRRFLAEGGAVAAVDRDGAALDRLAAALAAGEALLPCPTDVSREADCAALADRIRERWGRLDVLVNNAGYFPIRRFDELTFAEWREVVSVNLDSVFLMVRSLLPLMRGRGWGRIVNIGSGSVFKGPARQAHYVAAKAGVIGLTRCLANELGRDGITANVVTPGLTDTPGARGVFTAEELGARAATLPIPRVQRAEDLVGAVTFLASDDAAFITGQIVNVDGGSVLR